MWINFLEERLQSQLKSLKNQPSEEQKKKKLKKDLVQQNFARADKIKELTVTVIILFMVWG